MADAPPEWTWHPMGLAFLQPGLPLCPPPRHVPGSGGPFSRAGFLLLALTAVDGERQGVVGVAGGILLWVAGKPCHSFAGLKLGSLLDPQRSPLLALLCWP